MEVEDRIARVKVCEQPVQIACRCTIPYATGGRAQWIALTPDIWLLKIVNVDFGVPNSGSGLSRTDEMDFVAPLHQGERADERHLGSTAYHRSMITDNDYAHRSLGPSGRLESQVQACCGERKAAANCNSSGRPKCINET